jgi:hypothetical protein
MMSNRDYLNSGVVISLTAGLLFFIVFLDLLMLTPRPWPYVDGGRWESITLYQSFFWIQYIEHCQYLQPTFFGILIWKYWGILLALGLSQLVIRSQDDNGIKTQTIFGIKNVPSKGWIVVLFANLALYLLFAIRFRKSFSGGLVNPLFNPLLFLISAFTLILFPLITFLLALKGIRSESPLPVFGLFGWITFESLISTFLLNFLLWGCE